jgi:hypothetical protein
MTYLTEENQTLVVIFLKLAPFAANSKKQYAEQELLQ